MNALDQLSWGITANGVKANKIYALVPTDGSADPAFVRTTTTTRVNSLGATVAVAACVPAIDYTYTDPAFHFSPSGSNDIITTLTGKSALIGQTAGTLFSDFIVTSDATDKIIFEINDGTTANRLVLRQDTANKLIWGVIISGVTQGQVVSSALVSGTRYKAAGVYRNGFAALFINGAKVGQDTSLVLGSPTFSRIGFKTASSTVPFKGYKFTDLIYKIDFTDAQAIQLTQ